MNLQKFLSRFGGFLLIVVFAFNIYVGLYDTTLNKLSPTHHSLNWLIAVVCLIAAILLFLRPRSRLWIALSGIAWPLVYIFSLFLDVETLLCLGTNFSCWPSVGDAYDYLILGSRIEGWVLWPYTMRFVISILVITVILSILSIGLVHRPTKVSNFKQTGT